MNEDTGHAPDNRQSDRRMKATDVLRDKARMMRRRADHMTALANFMDEIEGLATSHVADVELALWDLACSVRVG